MIAVDVNATQSFAQELRELLQQSETDPAQDAAGLTKRGVEAFKKGDHVKASEDFEAAIRIDPKFADAYVQRASLRLAEGKLDEAFADSNLAVKLDPVNADGYEIRGTVHWERNQLDAAIRD